jgi:hypothetical protein
MKRSVFTEGIGGSNKIMKSKRLLVLAAALSLSAFSTFADHGDNWLSERTRYDRDADKYSANELTLDLFGSYNRDFRKFDDLFDHTWRHGEFGGGVGMNYFFTKYLGTGVDTFFQRRGRLLSNVTGNLILRAPLGNSGVAPYVFGGAGWRDSEGPDELTADGGVGIEFRPNAHVGIFTDIRYVWTDKTADEGLIRLGLRFGLK